MIKLCSVLREFARQRISSCPWQYALLGCSSFLSDNGCSSQWLLNLPSLYNGSLYPERILKAQAFYLRRFNFTSDFCMLIYLSINNWFECYFLIINDGLKVAHWKSWLLHLMRFATDILSSPSFCHIFKFILTSAVLNYQYCWKNGFVGKEWQLIAIHSTLEEHF